jgi:sugar/nucleoside kinase (ribokinase family)
MELSTVQRTLCVGEVLVDLICERSVTSFAEADAFVPHFGGGTANVGVTAARHGSRIALAGGVGQDPWGDWLRRRVQEEQIDLTWFMSLPGIRTPVACVVVAPGGEPTFTIYGESIEDVLDALSEEVTVAVEETDALFIGSNTLVGQRARQVTGDARARALELGRPVIVDANLRLDRWPSARAAIDAVRDIARDAHLLRTNGAEASILTGRADPDGAARDLLQLGCRCVVVTLGPDGALVRGEVEHQVDGVAARPISTVGAGDAFTGVLVAALTVAGYDLAAVPAALSAAVEEGARATERWGAVAAARDSSESRRAAGAAGRGS